MCSSDLPVIVNYLREYQLEQGVPRAQVYDTTAYILCGLLALGFICNYLVKPVADRHFMTDAELEAERKLAHEAAQKVVNSDSGPEASRPTNSASVLSAWIVVGVPILWGVWVTLEKAAVLFR